MFKGEMIDKLALVLSAESEMQKMWFNLLFHHITGSIWPYMVQAGNKIQH